MNSILGIGITGLRAHQQAISTTGNNITNANVPSYSRQRVIFDTQGGQLNGAGYLGSGVKVSDIERVVDRFLVTQLRLDTSNYNAFNTLASHFSALDTLLADSSTGIAPAMQNFFSALQQATQDPTSLEVRQVVLSSAASVAERFNALYGALQEQEASINGQLDALAGQVTTLAQALADLNRDIAEYSHGGGMTGQPNMLLDKRDALLLELSELVGIKVSTEASGMVNVFMGNGQSLVMGTQASILTTEPSRSDPRRQDLVFSAGAVTQSVSRFLEGGVIGGLLAYREQSLDLAFNQLGRIALTLADTFNAQQRSGLDLSGQFGDELFADINAAALQRVRAIPASTNGNAQLDVRITDTRALSDSDYQLNIGAGGNTYTLVRLSDGEVVASGTDVHDIEVDGFALALGGGTLQEGDRFLIAPTRTGAQDIDVTLSRPEKLAFAQPLRIGANIANQGSGTVTPGSFVTAQQLDPPVLIQFTSAHTFDVLDNSNPDAPVPISGLTGLGFTPGGATPVTIRDPVTNEVVYEFELGGRPVAGDSFTIEFNAHGSSDNRNALAMAALRDQPTMGQRQNYESAYGLLVERVGARTAELKINRDAADTLLAQTEASRNAVSGVNLDEEAANLIRFEQAYNASAQVINMARSLFESLLAALR